MFHFMINQGNANDMALMRQGTVTWTRDDKLSCRRIVSLGHSALIRAWQICGHCPTAHFLGQSSVWFLPDIDGMDYYGHITRDHELFMKAKAILLYDTWIGLDLTQQDKTEKNCR